MFKIMSYIYLDNFNQSYKKIIIINSNPNDSNINEIIKIIPRKKKSIFDYPSMYEENPYCVYAFLNPNNKSQFISVDDIDILLSYLIKKNYKVETEFTTLMCNNPKQVDKNLICYISKLI